MRALDLRMISTRDERRAYGLCFYVYFSGGRRTHMRTSGVILARNEIGYSAKRVRRECSLILGIRPTFKATRGDDK